MCKSVHNETAEIILRLLGAGVTSVCATGDGPQTVVVFEIKMIAASEIHEALSTHSAVSVH